MNNNDWLKLDDFTRRWKNIVLQLLDINDIPQYKIPSWLQVLNKVVAFILLYSRLKEASVINKLIMEKIFRWFAKKEELERAESKF